MPRPYELTHHSDSAHWHIWQQPGVPANKKKSIDLTIPSCANRSRRPAYALHFESALREYDAACASHLGKHTPQLAHFTKNRPIDHQQFVEFVAIDRRYRPSIPQYSPGQKPRTKRKRKRKPKYEGVVPWHLPHDPSSDKHVQEIVVTDKIKMAVGDIRRYSPGKAPWHIPEKEIADSTHFVRRSTISPGKAPWHIL
mmetsp:Transcript_28200/g.67890  ORF Transcript_28200/g.67890 Transcript_28200/m.67890 type:complete len:197 (-) Transcript_28200:183-773(-)